MTTKPTIELRKLKHSKSLSEETPAYTADVYVDGRLFGHVSNHGQGGPDMVHPPRGTAFNDVAFNQRLAELEKRIGETYPPHTFNGGGEVHTYKQDLEMVCHCLIDEMQIEADLRRLLRRTIAFFDPKKKAVMSYKGKMTDARRVHILADISRAHSDATILNDLPFAKALELYRSAT